MALVNDLTSNDERQETSARVGDGRSHPEDRRDAHDDDDPTVTSLAVAVSTFETTALSTRHHMGEVVESLTLFDTGSNRK